MISKLPPSKSPRFTYTNPTQGMRFPRSSREAFGVQVHFDAPRNPDAPVIWACAIAAVILACLIVTGAA